MWDAPKKICQCFQHICSWLGKKLGEAQSVRLAAPSSAIDSCSGQVFSPAVATRPAVRLRSSAEPHSLVIKSAPCGHFSWHPSAYFWQDWRMWSWVWSACLHSHREVSEMPVLFRWALRPQCLVCRWNVAVCWACSLGTYDHEAWNQVPSSFSPFYIWYTELPS